jgi:hypothetical protein
MPPRAAVEGHAIRPRDLSLGVLKGGTEPRRLFQRVRTGMPGTPMPAVLAGTLDDGALWDLVNYLGALIPAGAQALHDPVRLSISAVFTDRLPRSAEDPAFAAAPEVHLALAPFRAGEATIPGLSVRALHDGELVVLRLSYPDPSRDVPDAAYRGPPDGIAVRLSLEQTPPVLPIPGQPLPVDRALWLAGPMPEAGDPDFDGVSPRFENPDRVCVSPIGPELVGSGRWRDGLWTVVMAVDPERAGEIERGGSIPVSFAVFDGVLRRGPMPVAFTPWHRLRFQ